MPSRASTVQKTFVIIDTLLWSTQLYNRKVRGLRYWTQCNNSQRAPRAHLTLRALGLHLYTDCEEPDGEGHLPQAAQADGVG
jgi:hypothetical protein